MPSRNNRVGLVLEGSEGGADEQVCQYAVRQIAPSIEVVAPITMGKKPDLLEKCGAAASKLLQIDRCAHVFIIWDLFPSQHGTKEKPSAAKDIRKARQSLEQSKIDQARITLICIAKELEAWLIADHRAVNKVVRAKSHENAVRDPDHEPKPKTRLNRIFLEKLNRTYEGHRDAKKIAENITDCRYVGNSCSFRQFSKKLKELEKTLGK